MRITPLLAGLAALTLGACASTQEADDVRTEEAAESAEAAPDQAYDDEEFAPGDPDVADPDDALFGADEGKARGPIPDGWAEGDASDREFGNAGTPVGQRAVGRVVEASDDRLVIEGEGRTRTFRAEDSEILDDLVVGQLVSVTYEERGEEDWIQAVTGELGPGGPPDVEGTINEVDPDDDAQKPDSAPHL